MRVEIRDYKTGWLSVEICLKEEDIESLIRALAQLKQANVGQHFHFSNLNLEGPRGIFDIEFSKDEETGVDTFQGPSGFARAGKDPE